MDEEKRDQSGLYMLAQNVRLVVSDMDGTLLNARKELSPRTLAAVTRLRQKGIFFTICSGRVYPMLTTYSKQLGIDGPVITCNGAAIVHTADGRVLEGRHLPEQDALKLMEFCDTLRLDYCALTADASYFSMNGMCIQRFEQYNQIARANHMPEVELLFLDEAHRCILGKKLYKMLVYHPQETVTTRVREFIGSCAGLTYTSSGEGLVDISAAGTSKGEGVRTLARLLKIPLEQVCAFGDYDNDISMLQAVGLPVSMANGSTGAKQAALLVAGPNDGDGVACALEQYFI